LLEQTLIGRRQFLGSLAAGAAVAAVPAQAKLAMPVEPKLLGRALAAMQTHRPSIANPGLIAIADYAAPSREKRFYLVNLVSGQTTSYLVAHGRGSDPAHCGFLTRFSNKEGSYASCAGAFVTGSEYQGKHGRSMRLEGLDPSNSNAMPRAIVIHAAPYVSAAMARDLGKVGRSQGCFTVTEADLAEVMGKLGPGRFLYSDKV
jgi:hypothetical protein